MTLPQFPKQDSAFSRRDTPEVCFEFLPAEDQRAQGMPGAQCARSLACEIKQAHEHSHHGHTGTTRHSPRNGFTAYFALSSVTTLFDTVACASSHRLDAKDWGVGTTRLGPYASRPRSSRALPASTASRSTLMTLRNAPLRGRDVLDMHLIWVGRKQKYFCKRGLTRLRKIRSDLPVGQNQPTCPHGFRSEGGSDVATRKLSFRMAR